MAGGNRKGVIGGEIVAEDEDVVGAGLRDSLYGG